MDKININLLPKEIVEKRKFEQRLAYVLLGVGLLVAVFVAVYAVNFVRIMGEERKLTAIQAENARYAQAISQIQTFEKARLQVEDREKLIATAIAGKFEWSKLLNNISLIIPNEVWLTSFDGSVDGLTFGGYATRYSGTTELGYRPVAKWLVRLGEISALSDVWLTSSEKGADQGANRISWQTTAKLKMAEQPQASAVSAPPPPSGGGTGQ